MKPSSRLPPQAFFEAIVLVVYQGAHRPALMVVHVDDGPSAEEEAGELAQWRLAARKLTIVDLLSVQRIEPLTHWVIYDNPRDQPGAIVVRALHIYSGRPEPVPDFESEVFESVDQARDALRALGLTSLGRQEADGPVIVETFI